MVNGSDKLQDWTRKSCCTYTEQLSDGRLAGNYRIDVITELRNKYNLTAVAMNGATCKINLTTERTKK